MDLKLFGFLNIVYACDLAAQISKKFGPKRGTYLKNLILGSTFNFFN